MHVPKDILESAQSALALHHQGQYADAISHYQNLGKQQPDWPELHVNLGSSLLALGKTQEAIAALERAVQLRPDYAQAHFNLAIAWKSLKNSSQTIHHYQQALGVQPDFYEAHLNLANLFFDEQTLADAYNHYQRAAALRPDLPKAFNGLGKCLNALGRPREALRCYHKALRADPGYLPAAINAGIAVANVGCAEEGVAILQKLASLKPDHLEVLVNLGVALNLAGQYDEALACYEQALKSHPDNPTVRWNRALLFLLQGRFQEGWADFHWRRQTPMWDVAYPHTLKQPQWDGQPYRQQRLLIHYEQGFGDNFQFLRYLPRVKALGGTLLLEVRPAMSDLVSQWNCIDQLIVCDRNQPPTADIDLQASIMDLPAIFNTTLETIPRDIPYLYPDPKKVSHWRKIIGTHGYKIGVTWAGTRAGRTRVGTLTERTMQLSTLAPLANLPGIRLLGLQKDLPASPDPSILEQNLGSDLQDFTDTAAAIACMDLVISIDTSVAHLAGALGANTWTLLKYDADWRWMLEREDSPWYPTMRLFRQNTRRDWKGVIQRVVAALQAQRAGDASVA
ncbi:tetratricopeptide repeat protein [Planctomycetota bacterium]